MNIEVTAEELDKLIRTLSEKTIRKTLIPSRSNSESNLSLTKRCWSPLMFMKNRHKKKEEKKKVETISIDLKKPEDLEE